MIYNLFGNDDGGQNVTVFHEGELLGAHSSHPRWSEILQGVLANDESVIPLFNPAQEVAARFERLSDRVTVKGGTVYLDGDPVNNALTQQVVRFLDAGVDDWGPLVAFFDNVQANTNEHSREQLFEWLSKRDFTITQDGLIVAYKGVQSDNKGGYESVRSGPAIVNGEAVNGHVPNNVGDVVEMSRSSVVHDPAVGCSVGLHVGTYDYAKSWGYGIILEVHVNPRDVVSVPTDCDWAKVRCCRYTVVDAIEVPYASPVLDYSDPEYDDWGGDWEDYEDDREGASRWATGDRVIDEDGDTGTVSNVSDGVISVDLDEGGSFDYYDDSELEEYTDTSDLEFDLHDRVIDGDGDTGTVMEITPGLGYPYRVQFDEVSLGDIWYSDDDIRHV